jgi:mannose-1-phosphate guanylyltransferase
MKVLLLAAGFGTRLRPLTDNTPKCLVDINGKPLLQIWLDLLVAAGMNNILVNTHYLSEKVKNFINHSSHKEFITVVYEKKLLGTGGTLLKNRSFIGDEPIMLVHADNLSQFDMTAFINYHTNRPVQTEMTMMIFNTDVPQSCGIVELDEKGIVVAFHEKIAKPPGTLANGAVYILEPSIINFLAGLNKEEIDFSNEVLPHFIGKIYTFKNEVYHRDIGTVESYAAALKEFV